MADLVDMIHKSGLLLHEGKEIKDPVRGWVWRHADDCTWCRAMNLFNALVAAMEYRPCVRFDMSPCRSRPEINEEDWCAMCRAVELRERG